jgi:hypothetical protein
LAVLVVPCLTSLSNSADMPALGAPALAGWAAGFPTLFSTASGVVGLAAGPSTASRLGGLLSEASQLA